MFFMISAVLSFVGTFGGVAAFALLFFKYKNYNAALWSLGSGIFAGGIFHIQLLHLLHRLEVWHDKSTLGGLKVLGAIVSGISTVASGTYLALAITKQQVFSLQDGNYYTAATFSLLTLLWAVLLVGGTSHVQKKIGMGHPPLLHQP